MSTSDKVAVRVVLSGWLSSYFDGNRLIVSTTPCLADAIPDIVTQVMDRARSPVPSGGMSILINGVQAQVLVQQGYVLQVGDEITLVPVVAGG
jgi:molybdopterin converting factor small subunit